ncbi:MAG: hypothetical protein LW870_23395 [Pirellula sp.]|nr:hypothetical protein [Pirellula sp.]
MLQPTKFIHFAARSIVSLRLPRTGKPIILRYTNRFRTITYFGLFLLVALCAMIAWIRYFVIPSNLVIVNDTIAKIQADHKSTGDLDSLARTDLENCWGQPIKTLVVTVGLPSDVH